MPPITDPESKRKLYTYLAEGIFAIAVLGLAAPFLYSALEGAILLAALGALGILTWGFAAPFGQWVANKRIAALKAGIEANPIETMQGIYAERYKELQEKSKAIAAVDTQYRNVQSLIDNLPGRLKPKAAKYQELANKIMQGEKQMQLSYNVAAKGLSEYSDRIEEAKSLWEVACALNKAIAVSQKAKMDAFRDIKQQVAFDAVTSNLNSAFAALDETIRTNQVDSSLVGGDEAKALPASNEVVDAEVIDLTKAGQHQKIAG